MTPKKEQELPYKPEDVKLFQNHLKNIILIRVLILRSNYYRDEIIDQVEGLQMGLNIENNVTVYTNPEHKQAWAHVHLVLSGKCLAQEYNDKVAFKIEATIEARYAYNSNDLSDSEFSRSMNAFCHTVSTTHTWSFFRQLIVDSLSRMMLPPVMLPLMFNPNIQAVKSQPKVGKDAIQKKISKKLI